ncbi:phytoene desaturase family protein [Falsiroseomonas selenitidurans]|uniref:Phytoene dehydrogenase n=1 Tax=Falsiroseomonas selenitidurans TaxID=2716335 RepID=A0ABX1EAI0_9PROT|nr:phytoene desaturase family protein [Falsiroseomonas selenitidurans]NKC33963.1 phytoene desaturase [Falsiroseomonas selenitidurans]
MMDGTMAPDGRPHAVVIGAGFGGLAAAIRLGARGWRVTVVEKLDAPGGRAYVFRQDGFTFDAGPTIITAPYLLEELWTLCGRRMADDLDLRAMNPFYRIRFDDGTVLSCSADLEATRAEIARIAPEDLGGFDRFIADSERIFRVAFAELADQPFHRIATLLRAVPDMIRLQGYRTVFGKVGDYFTNPKLRIAFSFHPLLIGGNPLDTTAYYCLIAHLERLHGVHYAMGGMGAVVDGLVGLMRQQGGRLRCKAEVTRITETGGRASGIDLADGTHIAADIVVSNADVGWTYTKLLGRHPRKRWTDAKLARAHYSMSLFVWYFGTSRRYEDVDHHTMVLGPRYEELLRDIFVRKVLAKDMSLYLHRPTATDPSMAPPGCDSFYVLSPVPNLAGATDWAAQAEPYRAAIQQRLEATVLPGLGEAIVTSRILTPLDFRDRLLSMQGAAFSFEPRLFQSAWFRPHNVSEELPGLYLVGAGTHPGAGVPGVVSSARILDQVVPHGSTLVAGR